MNLVLKNKIIVTVLIILLAISPSFALGAGNRNILLIGAMAVTPLFIFRYPIIIPKIDIPIICLCTMMILFPFALHPETMRWSTVLYSCMFCLFFMAFVRVFFNSNFTKTDFLIILKVLIFAYCIVLIIQQICVLTGLPIFNVSNYSPQDPWKLNSLMSEPSHSARIIPIMMYMYLQQRELIEGQSYDIQKDFKSDKFVWIAFLWPIFTMGSATGFIFLFIVLLKILRLKKIISLLVLLIIIGGGIIFLSKNPAFERAISFSKAFLTFDQTKMITTDHSAACRVVPTLIAAQNIDLNSLDGWFGHGIDADRNLPKMPGVPTAGAGALYIWYNYGFIVALSFWIFTFSICYKRNSLISILIWFLTVFIVGGLNNQIVWFVITLSYTCKYFTYDTYENNSFNSRESKPY